MPGESGREPGRRKSRLLAALATLGAAIALACGTAPDKPLPDIEATVAARVQATVEARTGATLNTPVVEPSSVPKLPMPSGVIPLPARASGTSSSAPQQTQEFEAQPTSRFARGEAISIVQTWLSQRDFNYTSCTELFTPIYVCPDEAKERGISNCLQYLNYGRRTSDWSESFQSNGVSRVTLIWLGGHPWAWDVYEQSQSVRTVTAPSAADVAVAGVVPPGVRACR